MTHLAVNTGGISKAVDVDLSVDAESIGLHGDIFAIGAAVFNRNTGKLMQTVCLSYNPSLAKGADDSRTWVTNNVLPALPVQHTHENREDMLNDFWKWYRSIATNCKSIQVIADCGNSIEARLFSECIKLDEKTRGWEAPYPLHEVGTMRLAAGLDPLATCARINALERPVHHPVADAIQSHRLWREAKSRAVNGKALLLAEGVGVVLLLLGVMAMLLM